MKTKLILASAKSIEFAMFGLALAGLLIAIINLCTGNFGSTASFEP
jgi:hypothetical protein